MTEPEVVKTDQLIRRMSAALGAWLRQENWQPQQLIDWLEGHKLPRVGYDDEPYVWILRGLPLGDDRYWADTRLARRVAVVLKGEPDVKKPGKRPEQVLFNLLMLCAGLNCPDELNKPLKEVLKRRILKGEWLKVDLRYALQVALTWNQLDRTLEPVWMTMISRKRHPFLPGDESDGLDGILRMPPSYERRGEPCFDSIGKALKAMATHLETDHDRRVEYRALIRKIESSNPGSVNWDLNLLLQSHKVQLPAWAVECLSSLYVCIEESDKNRLALVWRYILDCIPETSDYTVLRKLCHGQVLEAKLTKQVSDLVDSIAPIFEKNRTGNPFPGDRSTWGVIIASVIEAKIDPRSVRIGKAISKILGGFRKRDERLDILEPLAAKVSGGELKKREIVRLADRSKWPTWASAYVHEMRISV